MDTMFKLLSFQVVAFLPRLVSSIVIFAVFWGLAILAKTFIIRVAGRTNAGRQYVFELAGQIARFSLIIFGLITALGTLGINVSALVAGLGLTGFALGFALKDSISNILGGVLILLYHPYKEKDYVNVAGYEGIVESIDLRYTILRGDNKKILIPNSTALTKIVTVMKQEKEAVEKASS